MYTLNNMGTAEECIVDNCVFDGCYSGIVGAAYTVRDCSFSNCVICLNTSNSGVARTNLGRELNVECCKTFINAVFGSYVYTSF